jgi:hypothetical protein
MVGQGTVFIYPRNRVEQFVKVKIILQQTVRRSVFFLKTEFLYNNI